MLSRSTLLIKSVALVAIPTPRHCIDIQINDSGFSLARGNSSLIINARVFPHSNLWRAFSHYQTRPQPQFFPWHEFGVLEKLERHESTMP